MSSILVTGGAGFIGSNFIIHWLKQNNQLVINIDKLTYAGNLSNLREIENNSNYIFVHGDIGDKDLVRSLLLKHNPTSIINFAAESHVDRSITEPSQFINTNILGTFNLLEAARSFWEQLETRDKKNFRFFHISTDEIYGSLEKHEDPFDEKNQIKPSSPYSASKASSDHLVRAWFTTFGLPILISNCSNNFGPYQFPEKLIPHVILSALEGKSIPIYGDGKQIRDWLFVEDHVKAIEQVLNQGSVGETYNIGGNNEKTNIDVVREICNLLNDLIVDKPNGINSFKELITHVKDRPGHDTRYAVDASKITSELGWKPDENFQSALHKTVNWYLKNKFWCDKVLSGDYRLNRIGIGR